MDEPINEEQPSSEMEEAMRFIDERELLDEKLLDDKKEVKEEVKEEKEEEVKKEVKEEENKEEKEEKTERSSKYVPVNKYNEQRKELSSLKKELSELRSAQEKKQEKTVSNEANKKETEDLTEKLSKKYENIDKDLIQGLIEGIKETIKPNLPKLPDNFDEIVNDYQQQKEIKKFDDNFDKLLDDFPELENHKNNFKKLAFTEGYTQTPLKVLAIYYLKENENNITAENSKGGGGRTQMVNFENLTEEDVKDMDREDIQKVMNWAEKH